MITIRPVSYDKAGFPVVGWTETRFMLGAETIECRIKRDPNSNELLFVRIGKTREGPFEEGRPWKHLQSFHTQAASTLYQTPLQQTVTQMISMRSTAWRMLMPGTAQVLLASFDDNRPVVPMHINCADCTAVEMAKLHDVLQREFHKLMGDRTSAALDKKILADLFIATPNSPVPVYEQREAPKLSPLMDAMLWLIPIAGVLAFFAMVFWVVGILRF